VPVRTSPTLALGEPAPLFTLPAGTTWNDFDMTRDGTRFLAVVSQIDPNQQPLQVILNWSATRTPR
jgi:hypothetical protein